MLTVCKLMIVYAGSARVLALVQRVCEFLYVRAELRQLFDRREAGPVSSAQFALTGWVQRKTLS